ncbi:MAG: NAD-dependent epimerase/dehydratase family protein, partial [Deltaproteobacteria bacterium]
YALQKWIGERYCQLYGRLYGLETVVLRYFNVFGPRQNLNSAYAAVIPNFIRALLKGEAPVIYGDGHQTRDFTYVANVVEANLAALEAENVAGRVINVASHRATSVNDLFRIVREIVGTSVDPRYLPPRPGDVKHSLADITLANTLLGYRCRVSLEEGLQRTVAWYRQRLAAAPRGGGER